MAFMIRTAERDSKTFVGVTSAMKYIKVILGEQPDYFGPLGSLHAMEGEGCHRICLDWLAVQGEYSIPDCPSNYPSSLRWQQVMERCIVSFQEFVSQYEVEAIGIEQEDFSSAYGLVGHIDLPCYMSIPRPGGRRLRVRGPVDLKFTASILESHRLQVRCYGRLDGMAGSNIGGIFHCDRDTGQWKFEEVSLIKNLDDVMAVSYAAHLYRWSEKKKVVL